MPEAARVTDMHRCPLSDGPKPHIGGPILPRGCPTVLIGGLPAARLGDQALCASAPDAIAGGSPTVLIGYQPAARIGDPTVHGGQIIWGCPSVLIGIPGQGRVLQVAAQHGIPFVQKCPHARQTESPQTKTLTEAGKTRKAFCEKCNQGS